MEKIKQWVRGKVKIADKGMDLIWTRRLSMGTELRLGKAAEWGGGAVDLGLRNMTEFTGKRSQGEKARQ